MKFSFGKKKVRFSRARVVRVIWVSLCLLVIASMMVSGFAYGF